MPELTNFPFSDNINNSAIEAVRLILLNKGYVMDKYVTFEKNIRSVLNALEGSDAEHIDAAEDATTVVDSIIKSAMRKRASDIHIEPLEDSVRVRCRIDGELVKTAEIKKYGLRTVFFMLYLISMKEVYE